MVVTMAVTAGQPAVVVEEEEDVAVVESTLLLVVEVGVEAKVEKKAVAGKDMEVYSKELEARS